MYYLYEVQSLPVISVNIWQILISLVNLLLLFLLIKKFLYKPVKNVLKKREDEIEAQYTLAADAQKKASENEREWNEKLSLANEKADEIIQNASDSAKYRGEKIIAEARDKAQDIISRAENEAELERKKASDDIRRQIVEVSGALTEKMLEREVNTDDHRALIDSFIEDIGDEND
jgi:F-type H+-transporting ATPase subunit b